MQGQPSHREDALKRRIEDSLLATVARTPDAAAIVAGEDPLSYAELMVRITGFSERLRESGVRDGVRVAIFLDKTVDCVVSLYATWTAGGIAVPINEGLRGPQIRHILDDADCAVVVTERRKKRRIPADALTSACCIEVESARPHDAEATPKDAESEDPRAASPTHAEQASVHPGGDEPAALLYTSGSSGRPKGIIVSHANLLAGARIVACYLGLRDNDRLLSVLPFSFDYGLNQLLTSVETGACLVLQRSTFPADVCRSLSEQRISVLAGVPPLFIQLMQEHSPLRELKLPELRILTNSGGVFPVKLVEEYRERLPHVQIFLMYGLSEAFRSSYLPPEEIARRPDSMGKAIPECEILLLDDEGNEVAPGEVGELVHRGPTVSLGYWRNPEATAAVFRPDPKDSSRADRVVFSGDLVRRDEEGFLYFVSRRDQMIKSMGYRISPDDVAEQLHRSELLAEVVVGSRPDPVAGAVLIAHVVPRDTAAFDCEALLAYCRREMPSYLIPQEVIEHVELPRTSSGKIDRQAVLR